MNGHCLHLLTGEGKGKSSAAAGMALRAVGHGMSVLYAQFMKNGSSGEIAVLRGIGGVRVYPMPPLKKFTFAMTPEERQEAAEKQREAVAALRGEISGDHYQMIVLDELMTALTCGLLDRETVQPLLEHGLTKAEVVVTGHGQAGWLTEMCDYVSEILPVKHPYTDRGLRGREGIEW